MGEFQILKRNGERRRLVHVIETENSDTPDKLPKADLPLIKCWEPLIEESYFDGDNHMCMNNVASIPFLHDRANVENLCSCHGSPRCQYPLLVAEQCLRPVAPSGDPLLLDHSLSRQGK